MSDQPDVSTPVVIFKKLGFPLQAAAISIARSLGRWGAPIYVFGEAEGSPLARSRYTTGVVPFPADDDDQQILDRLMGSVLPEGALLVPVDDPGALFAAQHADELRKRYRLPDQPPGLSHRLADKRDLTELARSAGLAVPQSHAATCDEDVRRFVADHGLPVVVKAGDPERLRRRPDRASVAMARTEAEAVALTRALMDGSSPNALLQEYIPGGPETVWMVDAYIASSGECAFAGVGRKIRQYPVGTGATTLGITEDNEAVLDSALRLLSYCGYRGIVDMGLRFDHRDGLYKILDVNPRIGATFRLFVSDAGMDVIRAMYLDLTGQPVAPSRSIIGRRWWLEPWDVASALASWRAGDLTSGQYLRSLRGVDETGLFARDDPRPFTGIWRIGAKRITEVTLAAVRESRPQPSAERDAVTVAAYFDRRAGYWSDVYEQPGLAGEIYRQRQDRASRLVERLGLGPDARVLDVGCGAGYMTAWLAGRGWRVDAIDTSRTMVEATRRRLADAGMESRCRCFVADIHHLPVPDGTYDLVVALGLLPWVADPSGVLSEMHRVVRPDGGVIVSADNRWNLAALLDPRVSPILVRVQMAASRARRRGGRRSDPADPVAATHSSAQLEELLGASGLGPVERIPVGYGPITMGGRVVLPSRAGLAVQGRMQRAADHGRFGLPAVAAQHLVLARPVQA